MSAQNQTIIGGEVQGASSNGAPEALDRIVSFEEAKLKEELLRGIYSYGWEKPSFIQQQGIPAILTGRDVMMQAQSGSGKTGTFTISVLQLIREDLAEVQGGILVPTRELADQVYKVAQSIGNSMKINFVKCVGKTQVRDNLAFPDRATILIGTPGKLHAVLSRKMIKKQPYNLRCFIIDEFDKMLEDEDFIATITDIFSFLNKDTQVVLSSATVSKQALEIAEKFMRNPIDIALREQEVSLEGIQQYHIDCEKEEWKFDTILDLYKALHVAQSIIYVNSKRKCDDLEERFTRSDFTVKSIHGGMEQEMRDLVMDDFRSTKCRILLSTDLTARGIDVPGVSLVINYDLPNDKAQYIHRIGRTGRYGKKGCAINLIGNGYEKKMLQSIEAHYGTTIPELPSNFEKMID
jgi:superfamily II DNA/RNA helicase